MEKCELKARDTLCGLYLTHLKRVLAEKESGKTNTKVNFPASVVWGGIEPPTQGFSVLCSTD